MLLRLYVVIDQAFYSPSPLGNRSGQPRPQGLLSFQYGAILKTEKAPGDEVAPEGFISQGFLRCGVKNVLKLKQRTYSSAQNVPRTPKGKYQVILLEGEQTTTRFWQFFKDTREKLDKNWSTLFRLQSISLMAVRIKILVDSFSKLVE